MSTLGTFPSSFPNLDILESKGVKISKNKLVRVFWKAVDFCIILKDLCSCG